MNQEELQKIYNKFPAILRSKLIHNEIMLPFGTQYVYEKFSAFRAIVRKTDDFTPVNKKDMRSYYELGKKPRGIQQNENLPSLYSVSLYKDYADIAMCFSFPNPNKKLAQGYVYAEGGPQYSSTSNSHVDWWLYETADFSGFKITEEYNG